MILLSIAFFLILLIHFTTTNPNGLHTFQLTNITARISLLYIGLVWYRTWSPVHFSFGFSFLVGICFLLFFIQTFTGLREKHTLVVNIILLFCPNLIFIFLLYFQILEFTQIATLLFVLQCIVVFFFWISVLCSETNELSRYLERIYGNPSLCLSWHFISTLITHFVYNFILVRDILLRHALSWTLCSWLVIQYFLLSYGFSLILYYSITRYYAIKQIRDLISFFYFAAYPCEKKNSFVF